MNGAFGGSSSARQAKFDTTLFLAKPVRSFTPLHLAYLLKFFEVILCKGRRHPMLPQARKRRLGIA